MKSDGQGADRETVDRIGAATLEALSAEERRSRALYIDTVVHPRGARIRLDEGRVVTRASDTVVVFVDDEPGKNWGHPCRYLLHDAETGEVETINAQFPPSLTDVPGTYRTLSLPPGVPEWALWFSG